MFAGAYFAGGFFTPFFAQSGSGPSPPSVYTVSGRFPRLGTRIAAPWAWIFRRRT